jgi:hypothetical protein
MIIPAGGRPCWAACVWTNYVDVTDIPGVDRVTATIIGTDGSLTQTALEVGTQCGTNPSK